MTNLVLVFDVETTGLLPKDPAPGNIPYIIQFSFALYDMIEKRVVDTYDQYICIPSTVVLKPEITKLTGVTRDILEEKGVDIRDALEAFYEAYQKADILVAHNMEFDHTMIMMEASVHFPELAKALGSEFKKPTYCTMKQGTDICQIRRTNSRGVYYKQPRLAELHQFFFGTIPEGLHNSMVDVLVCLKCYMKMRWGQNI